MFEYFWGHRERSSAETFQVAWLIVFGETKICKFQFVVIVDENVGKF